MSSSLNDGTNAEDDHDNAQGPLSADSVSHVRHEEAAQEGTELQHGSHETSVETTIIQDRVCVEELGHDVDDGDDTLVVTKRETTERCQEGSTKDERRFDNAGETTLTIRNLLKSQIRKVCGRDGLHGVDVLMVLGEGSGELAAVLVGIIHTGLGGK